MEKAILYAVVLPYFVVFLSWTLWGRFGRKRSVDKAARAASTVALIAVSPMIILVAAVWYSNRKGDEQPAQVARTAPAQVQPPQPQKATPPTAVRQQGTQERNRAAQTSRGHQAYELDGGLVKQGGWERLEEYVGGLNPCKDNVTGCMAAFCGGYTSIVNVAAAFGASASQNALAGKMSATKLGVAREWIDRLFDDGVRSGRVDAKEAEYGAGLSLAGAAAIASKCQSTFLAGFKH